MARRARLEEAEAAGVPLQIFLSTLSAEPDALSDYGRAKYELEQRFTAAQQIVFRLGVVVGDGGMYARIRSSATRLPVTPLLDGGRQLIYVLGIDTLCLCAAGCNPCPRRGLARRSMEPGAAAAGDAAGDG